jgi:hypothetical protein
MVANRADLLLWESGGTGLPVRRPACLCHTAECRGCECAHAEEIEVVMLRRQGRKKVDGI